MTARDPVTGLTPRMEKYAEGIAEGKSLVQAFSEAYDTSNYTQGSKYSKSGEYIRKYPEIMERVRELRKQAEEGAILDRQARQAMLTEIAVDETASRSDRLSALDKLNKMSGDYSETIRNEISGGLDVKVERHNVIKSLLKECGIDGND